MKATPLCASLLWLSACSGDATNVTSSAGIGFEPDLAVDSDRIAVAWYDNRATTSQIYFQLYDHTLTPLGDEHQISNAALPAYEASAAFIDSALAVAWYEVARNGAAQVHVGVWEFDGTLRWRKALSDVGQRARIPVLREHAGRLFVAWIEDAALRANMPAEPSILRFAWLDTDGRMPVNGAVGPAASPTTWNLNALPLDDLTMAVSYHAQLGTQAAELHVALIAAQNSRVLRLSDDDGIASLYPDLALHDNVLAMTWFDEVNAQSDIKLRLFPRVMLDSNVPLNLDQQAPQITDTAGESIGAYLAWADDILGLAWNDNSTGQHELYFQPFNAQGAPLKDAQRVTNTRTDSLIPAIEVIDGGFLLSWSEVQLDGHDSRRATVMLQRLAP